MTDSTTTQNESKNDTAPLFCSCRLIASIIAFLGCVIAYVLRLNLGFAMVCMVNKHTSASNLNNSQDKECQNLNVHDTSEIAVPAEFDWSKPLQGEILGAFFYGYAITQVPGGWLCEKFGAKIILSVGIGITSALCLVIPESSRISPYFLLVVRILQGMFGAISLPATHALISNWAPVNERGLLLSLTYSGIYVGTMITFPTSSLLCKHGFAGGWPSIFYVTGIIGILWVIGVTFFVYDNYTKHPRISERERIYLENGLGNLRDSRKKKVPWMKFLKSGPVWAITIAHLTANWGLYTLAINLPTYMDDVHKFRINENGFLSALPYICTLIVTLFSGKLSDYLIRRKTMSTTAVRKTFNSIGMFIPGICMLLLTFLNCTRRFYAVAVIVLLQAISGFAYSGGFFFNHVDIAPQFAGILMSITNLFGTVAGIASPIIVGFVTPNGTLSEWSIVFYIGLSAYILGGLFYLVFASGKEQNWDSDVQELQME